MRLSRLLVVETLPTCDMQFPKSFELLLLEIGSFHAWAGTRVVGTTPGAYGLGCAAKNCQMRCVAESSCVGLSRMESIRLPPGQAWPPPAMR